MGLIFVNYRQGLHSISVSALAERLARHFGEELVFLDNRLAPGDRYPDELRQRLAECSVLLAVIHTGWVRDLTDRRDLSIDWVEYEISTALTTGKTVIQLLLGDTTPPAPTQLPASISELALRQALRVRSTHFASDVGDLITELERHVAPGWNAGHAAVQKPARSRPAGLGYTTKVLAWAVVIGTLVLARVPAADDELWRALFVEALFCGGLMVLMGLMLIVYSITTPSAHRLERRIGKLSARSYLAKTWGIVILMVTVFVIGLVGIVNRAAKSLGIGTGLQVFIAVAGVVGVVYWIQRHGQKMFALDQTWPAVVTATPSEFRRAAHRLRERLTTWPEWRHPRPRLLQEQAVSVYLGLAEARIELAAQHKWSWRQWLRRDRSETRLAALYSGTALATTVVLVAASVSQWMHGRLPARVYVADLVLLTVTTLVAAAGIAIDYRIFHRRRGWLVEELSSLMAELGPLVFVPQARPDLPSNGRASTELPACASTEGDTRR